MRRVCWVFGSSGGVEGGAWDGWEGGVGGQSRRWNVERGGLSRLLRRRDGGDGICGWGIVRGGA